MTAAPQVSAEKALAWQLVQAAPGALLYSAPPVEAPGHRAIVTRRGCRRACPRRTAGRMRMSRCGIRRWSTPGTSAGSGCWPPRWGSGRRWPARRVWRGPSPPTRSPPRRSRSRNRRSLRRRSPRPRRRPASPGRRPSRAAPRPRRPTVGRRAALASVVSSSGGAQTSTTSATTSAEAGQPFSVGAPAASTGSGSETSTSVTAPGSASPEVVVRSSGGAQTGTADTGSAPARDQRSGPGAAASSWRRAAGRPRRRGVSRRLRRRPSGPAGAAVRP